MNQNESPSEIIEKLTESNKEFRSNTLPSIDDLHTMALMTQDKGLELGVSLYTASKGEINGSEFNVGTERSIYEPTPPRELRGKISSGVFIHCHPISEDERVPDGKSLHILPSGTQPFEGDFEASYMSRVVAGYLNVASEYGLTMMVGIEGIAREDDITRKMREKLGRSDLARERTWKVLSGEQGGVAMVGDEFKVAVDDKFSINEDVVLLSNTQELGVRYFLHISWDKLKELEKSYGSLENLCFGDGLESLLQELNIEVQHEKNLGSAAVQVYKMPKER